MVDLFNENTLFVFFFAMVAIYNYSALKEYQRMAIIYISVYALAALDIISIKLGLLFLIVALFCFFEIFTTDEMKFKILVNPIYKILDFMYIAIFQYSFLGICLALVMLKVKLPEAFFAFLEERDYSLSYKMPFLLAFIRHVDSIGDAKIEEILEDYIAFYQDRITRGLPVDRSTCPYNETMLQDKKAMQRSMLTNPFEKFERKRFLYYSKDLSVISMNHALYSQMEAGDWERVRRQMEEDLAEYYAKVEGAVLVKR